MVSTCGSILRLKGPASEIFCSNVRAVAIPWLPRTRKRRCRVISTLCSFAARNLSSIYIYLAVWLVCVPDPDRGALYLTEDV